MDAKRDEALQPELRRATQELTDALDEACGIDVKRADTGELIRIEEMLAIANEAAKTAVSIRRLRAEHRRERTRSGEEEGAESGAPEHDAEVSTPVELEPNAHRLFADATGTRWEAFAVYPSGEVGSGARLPEPYRHGWLAFECESEKRRLSPVPEGWETLADEGLRELCERAERVRRRTGPIEPRPPER